MKQISLTTMTTLLAFAFLPSFAQEKAPLILFDSQTKDFGKVLVGESLKHSFKFTNKGNATLEIKNVEHG